MNLNNASFITAFTLASIAAFGNALYAFGQKKAVAHVNPFLFGALSLFTGALMLSIMALFFNTENMDVYLKRNYKWILSASLGYVFLNVGLYFLYKNFGTAYYTLYAVLAMITTSILLAVIVFHERLNGYHIAALLSGTATMIFFLLSKNQ